MKLKPVTLEGKRVKLLPMEISHLDGMYEALVSNDKWKEIWKYRIEKIRTKEDLKTFMDEAITGIKDRSIIPFTIFDKKLNKIIGTTRFANISTEGKFLEIGWTSIAAEVMRTEVNTECKYLLLKHCFEDLKLNRVEFKTLSINERSQNAILRIGAKKEGEFRWIAQKHDGEFVNCVFFSIIKPEWNDVKKRLENFLI
jgi:N-acetyltransferase